MPRPVCVKCKREMANIKSGAVSFFAKVVGYATPYQQFQGDLYKCSGCGTEIISGYGRSPTYEHFQSIDQIEDEIAVSYEHTMRVE